jgi:UDP-N-acetyl-D-glucosamine/UDP-N-acetyl-D-galactosamine dehydrogenase
LNINNSKIGIIGLGYVGLPLAVEFGKIFPTVGFDINESRIKSLVKGIDLTLECNEFELQSAKHLKYTSASSEIKTCNVYIVTVPTPIDIHKKPDLTPLKKSSDLLGGVLSIGDTVIYESTVYPGCTEEVCVPILEKKSGLIYNKDFHVGYSPERINPGDKKHRLPFIKKVTSGSTQKSADFVDRLYGKIITAGTYSAPSIKVAEAAKVIENTQRDVNIALINELAKIFNELNIDTIEVLKAAETKWNFLPFRPGLVGGHCISVDPYYLTHKAQEIGYHPEVILSGRRINDGMGVYVASQVAQLLNQNKILVNGAKILIMGLSFKENCPDIRNTRVIDIVDELNTYGANIEIWDPWVNAEEAEIEFPSINLVKNPNSQNYDAIIIAVGHNEFTKNGIDNIKKYGHENTVIFDVKSIFAANDVHGRL